MGAIADSCSSRQDQEVSVHTRETLKETDLIKEFRVNLVQLGVDVPELGQLGQAVVPPQRVVVRQTSVSTCKENHIDLILTTRATEAELQHARGAFNSLTATKGASNL